jgi:hypothetical protein
VDTAAVDLRVWVDDWQMQCCGEPFRAASKVAWTLVELDPDSLVGVLGEEKAATVTHTEEHHSERGEPPTEGIVKSVRAVYCRMVSLPDDPRTFVPVPDSAVLVQVDRATGWEPTRRGLRFRGYLVDLRV